MIKSRFSKDIIFLACYFVASILLFALLRAILLYRNWDLTEQIPNAIVLKSFLVGMRFDLIVICQVAIPLLFALLLPWGLKQRKIALIWIAIAGFISIFSAIAELEFYHEFHTRLNSIAFQYLKEDPVTVGRMLWHGFPIIRYSLLILLIWGGYIGLLRWFSQKIGFAEKTYYPARLPLFLLLLFLCAWGARGTLRSGPPLRWGDAFFSKYLFANHLALNSTYSLIKAGLNFNQDTDHQWLKKRPQKIALKETRSLLLTPSDDLLKPKIFPILRQHTPQYKLPNPPKNIVFILMESFSGEFVGALGHSFNITPEFDALTQKGVLFDHFFSNGTHTHQGMFATAACFPNLPGHEYLMQEPLGQHLFSSLAAILKPRGFQDTYVYNGAFSWDNQEGFFRNQGMTHFIGRDDHKSPVFIDPTWGVSDQDMFDSALVQLNQMDKKVPFFAILQTLSNHTPFALPNPLPIEKVTGFGELNEHLTAQKYSDWALGQFMKKAAKESWYSDTIFVILGDHGFGIQRQLTEIDLLRFHVPLLIIAPNIQAQFGTHNHHIASQVDVIPSAVSLLGMSFKHQCWGRDIFSLDENDKGFVIIKPSGSDQTIALIKDHLILIKPPQSKAILKQFQLYPQQIEKELKQPELKKQMENELFSFIATAIRALKEDKTALK